MLKQVVIIALGLSALGYHTFASAIAALNSPASAPLNGDNFESAADVTDALAVGDEQFLDRLTPAVLRGFANAESLPAAATGGAVSETVDRWNAVIACGSVLNRLQSLPSPLAPAGGTAIPPDANLMTIPPAGEKLQELTQNVDRQLHELSQIRNWAESCIAAVNVSTSENSRISTESLQNALAANLRQVDGAIGRLEQVQANARLLSSASAEFQRREYGTAIETLTRWRGERPEHVAELDRRSRFNKESRALIDAAVQVLRTNNPQQVKLVAERLEEFIGSTSPASIAAADSTVWRHCQEAHRRVVVRARILSLQAVGDLAEWLREAAELAAADTAGKPIIRDRFLSGLGRRLSSKQARATDKQVAITSDGVPKQGIFQLHSTGNWYRFWPTRRAMLNGPGETIGLKSIVEGPVTPKTIDAAKSYNATRDELMLHPASKSAWVKLRDDCRRLQDEIEDFRKTFVYDDDQDLSFIQEAGFASDVVNHWDQVAAVLKQ